MLSNFDACLDFTLKAEGGFVNDPRDSGGATKNGITLTTLTDWRQQHGEPPPPLTDLQNISTAEVRAIYGAEFWNRVNGDNLPYGVDLMVFDFGVTAAPARSARMLQVVLREPVKADSWIGPKTLDVLSALYAVNPQQLIGWLYAAQGAYYKSLSAYATFGTGWTNRLDKRKDAALAMLSL